MNNYFEIIKQELEERLKDFSFEIKGILLNDSKTVITVGNDSKLIGKVFEILLIPHLQKICSKYGWEFEPTKKQNIYPDFNIGIGNNKYIAIDIKTTYRKHKRKIKFTLGSYTSFMRDGMKNIQHNYRDYISHYVIGFVYDRSTKTLEGEIFDINKPLYSPYNNVEWFIQEKYKISSDKTGSGNTENIGSIESGNIGDFRKGNGIFTKYGEKGLSVFEDYWKNYPKYRKDPKKYNSIETYEKMNKIVLHYKDKTSKNTKNE